MVRKSPLAAIPLDSRALASRLGCSYETLIRRVGDFAEGTRRTVWTFQAYGFVVFLRYRKHETAKCGHPQFYVISRHALHRIGGAPGRVRARLRQKNPAQWLTHLALLKKLAFGILIRGRERANDKHKASPSQGNRSGAVQTAGRAPPTANRAGFARFIKIAGHIQREYDALAAGPRINLVGWACRRLAEWHNRVRIVLMLRHAVDVMPRGRFEPANPAAWICAVAERHLDGDGLGKIQRWQELHPRKKAAPGGAALKEELRAPNFVDADGVQWQCFGGTDWRKI